MGGKSKAAAAPPKTAEEKAAEKAEKKKEKASADLLKAAKAGERSKVESSLELGANINHTNEKGQTAAHIAAAYGETKIVRLLYQKGADFSLQTTDKNKFTPLTAARFIGEEATAKLIEALLEGRADEIADESDGDDDDEQSGPQPAGSAVASSAGGLPGASGKKRREEVVAVEGGGAAAGGGGTGGETAADVAAKESAALEAFESGPFIAEQSDAIDKSESDHREYRWLKLSNEMQVMLVSDPTCDYAAAAMDVGVGSASDPEELPGLAHFLEHMLFLGTTKYPREDEYTSYVEQHGGASNAFTAHEDTHYYFDVQHPFLSGSLDRFAQFFLCPLFTESATERELAAVDSEFAKNVQSDAWRHLQLMKWSADPRHPWSRFNAGNRECLSDKAAVDDKPAVNVRESLVAFHASHYSSNLMSLAVLGRESLDKLQKLVVSKFCNVPNQRLPSPRWPHPPYPVEALGRYFRVVPVRDSHSLTVTWPLPPIRDQYRSKPFRYVSHILGHEGEGSLLSMLKGRGWADQLVAGETQSHSDFATFICSITLTTAGSEHAHEIVPLVFAAVEMIRARPPARWVFDEMGGVSRMRFRFCDTIEPSQAVHFIAQSLPLHPPAHALSASWLFDVWSPDEITHLLSLLSVDGCNVVHVSPQHEELATQKDRWYGTMFDVSPIGQQLRDACLSPPKPDDLRFPERNEFIPTDFRLVCDLTTAAEGDGAGGGAGASAVEGADASVTSVLTEALQAFGALVAPHKIHEAGGHLEVWHKVDRTFRRPKTQLYIEVHAPEGNVSPDDGSLTQLCFRLLDDELTEFVYPAEIAALAYRVDRTQSGFVVSVSGYSHKLMILLRRVLEKVRSPTLDAERLGVQRDLLLKSYRNWFKGNPHVHARYATGYFLEQRRWHLFDFLGALEDAERCSHANLLALHARLLSALRMKVFCHGNTDADATLAAASEAADTLGGRPLTAEELSASERRCLKLPAAEELVLRWHPSLFPAALASLPNMEETNSAVELTLQGGVDARPDSQIVELLCHILSNPAYEALRTVEQLGYIVELGVRYDNGVFGLRVLVQSSEHTPEYVDERIEAFLATVPELLANLEPQKFADHRESLIRSKLQPPKTLRDETATHWTEISRGLYDFRRDEAEAAVAASLTKVQLIDFWKEHFDVGAAARRKLSSRVYAPTGTLPEAAELRGAGGRKVRCIDGLDATNACKRSLEAFPPAAALALPRASGGSVAIS